MAFLNTKLALITLRLIHIIAGVLWVGGAAALTAFVLPAARDEHSMTYLRRLIWNRNLPRYLNITLVLALLSGLTMYGNLSFVTQGAWARSRTGMTLGLGGALAVVAALIATFVAAPAIHRALELTNDTSTTSSTADASEVDRALSRYAGAMRLVTALLIGTAGLMAIARYM
jgi:uncharacterized membrane protein